MPVRASLPWDSVREPRKRIFCSGAVDTLSAKISGIVPRIGHDRGMTTATTLSLDGEDWTIREALGDTAEWYLGAPLPAAGNNVAEASATIAAAPGWIAARVPGAVIDDLHRAGEVPDPRVGRNSRAAEWVAERSWVYRRAVDLDASAADG